MTISAVAHQMRPSPATLSFRAYQILSLGGDEVAICNHRSDVLVELSQQSEGKSAAVCRHQRYGLVRWANEYKSTNGCLPGKNIILG